MYCWLVLLPIFVAPAAVSLQTAAAAASRCCDTAAAATNATFLQRSTQHCGRSSCMRTSPQIGLPVLETLCANHSTRIANSHPQVSGFDLVDDESKPERRPNKHMPKPHEWSSKHNPGGQPGWPWLAGCPTRHVWPAGLSMSVSGLKCWFKCHCRNASLGHSLGSFLEPLYQAGYLLRVYMQPVPTMLLPLLILMICVLLCCSLCLLRLLHVRQPVHAQQDEGGARAQHLHIQATCG